MTEAWDLGIRRRARVNLAVLVHVKAIFVATHVVFCSS
jgi:hypothetical protein